MKDNRLFWVTLDDSSQAWSMHRGAVALAKYLEPRIARMEDRGGATRLERVKSAKAAVRRLLEDPTAGVYREVLYKEPIRELGYGCIDGVSQVYAMPPLD